MFKLRGKRKWLLGISLFLTTFMTYFITLNVVWATDHTASLLHLDYAVWTNHSFALGRVGQYSASSVDDFIHNGDYYTALAPGASLFSLPFVIPGFILDGGFNPFGYANLLSELFVAFMNSIGVLLVYRVARFYFTEGISVFLAIAYGFSTISWPFATFFFQSDVSAAFALAGVFLVLKVTHGPTRTWTALLAGLAIGAATITDYVSALLIFVLVSYLAVVFRTSLRSLLKMGGVFLLGAAQGVVAIALYNISSFGSPLITSEQLYLHSNSLLSNFSTPIYVGVILNLVTPLRGVLLFSPIVILGIFGFRIMLTDSSVRREGYFLLGCFLVLFLPYCAWYSPEGGLSFGPRFVIASLPFLLIPGGFVIRGSRRWSYLGYGLFLIGAVENGLAAMTSALASGTQWLSSPFLESTLPLFQKGTLDQWWKPASGMLWPAVAGLIVMIPLFVARAALFPPGGSGPGLPDQQSETSRAAVNPAVHRKRRL
jgi:hypothetical protein